MSARNPLTFTIIALILEAARCAPTATNAQAYRLWVVKSPEGIEKVNQAKKNGYGANTFLILGADRESAWTRETDRHSFADIDAGIVGTHILFEVQQLGLGTTWVGRVDAAKLWEIFPETRGYDIAGIFPIGYPASDGAGQPSRKHTTQKPLEEIVWEL